MICRYLLVDLHRRITDASLRALPILLLVLSCSQSTHAQEVLFDNISSPDSPNLSVFPFVPEEWAAQSFRTQSGDRISAVSIEFRPLGNPTGSLNIEIWDQSDSAPGAQVGTVGIVELSELESGWTVLDFDELSIPVEPSSSYYLLLNSSSASIDPSNSYEFATYRSDEGTFGADTALGFVDGQWQSLSSLLGPNASYISASVEAVPEPNSGQMLLAILICSLGRRGTCHFLLPRSIVAGRRPTRQDTTGDNIDQ